ncbi:hypothetical protein HS99_0005995 [Kitasatospora aureofaciens]|uniref:Uncharacterized protein n=1 Tax=Kitasatospora aureofaciens TaxID=1894 RepID=A0A1E7N9L2_KITAU|nr:hypothetical protein HS99_0005995 [Kitasatospora aureofaciens]
MSGVLELRRIEDDPGLLGQLPHRAEQGVLVGVQSAGRVVPDARQDVVREPVRHQHHGFVVGDGR